MSATETAAPRSQFLQTMHSRGYIHQCTDEAGLDEACSKGIVTGYIGFDATASSLHVGSLIQIMMLRRLQQAGHRPLVVMGGGTTKVGDPSGKDESRKMLTEADIAANIEGIKQVFAKFLTFGDGPTDAIMVDNDAWLSKLGYIEFLREYGTHFTINRMLTFDSVKLRLEREQPLTFLEFNYMLMQATDFLELYKRHGCALQMGGSDQWGNIVNGTELVRRKAEGQAFGLTTPLLTTASGAKMGKTAAGAVWLNADLLSPYDYWQFWRNVDDADVGKFLRLFTDLPLDEIARLEALAPRSTTPRRCSPTSARGCCTGPRRPRPPTPPPGPRSRKAGCPPTCRRSKSPAPSWKLGSPWRPWLWTPAWPRRALTPDASPRAAACASTTPPRPTASGF